MAIALYISENQYFIGIFRVNGLEMLISLIYKSLTKMHAVFRAFRAIYNFVLHMLNFLVDTSEIGFKKMPSPVSGCYFILMHIFVRSSLGSASPTKSSTAL